MSASSAIATPADEQDRSPPATAVPIAVRRVTGRADGPRLLVIAGVHGDEYEPMEAVRRLAATLATLAFRGSVTLVPVANPTAFASGSRTGSDGLDMARSFPGAADGSPTRQAAQAVTHELEHADLLIDLHTGGRVLRVLPMTGYMLHPDPRILATQRRMARSFGLPVIWGTSPALQGRSLSAARDLGVPAIYAEHGGGGSCDPRAVDDYVRGCLNVMQELEMIAVGSHADAGDDPARPAVSPLVVEDPRPGSGHLQASHPAPAAGFFLPRVPLGAWVDAGDVVGTISDPLGERVHDVLAQTAGLVLVMRAEPSVRVGDALAVILERPDGGAEPRADASRGDGSR
jgi:predicted deacylase